MVHCHNLRLGCAVGHRLLLPTDKSERKTGVRASHEQDPRVGGPTGTMVGREVRIGESCHSKILRIVPVPTNQSNIRLLVNVTRHAAQAFSVSRSPPVDFRRQ
eukprot:802313-Alexandrium_andersonii.AAC.1